MNRVLYSFVFHWDDILPSMALLLGHALRTLLGSCALLLRRRSVLDVHCHLLLFFFLGPSQVLGVECETR